MTLHGIYDNGSIELLEKNLPKIKTKITVEIPMKFEKKKGSIKSLIGLWKDRKDIKNSAEWVLEQRRLINSRLK
jgi:hypothetical protein